MIKSRKKAPQASQAPQTSQVPLVSQTSLEACNAFARKTDRSLQEQARKDQARKDVAAARELLKKV